MKKAALVLRTGLIVMFLGSCTPGELDTIENESPANPVSLVADRPAPRIFELNHFYLHVEDEDQQPPTGDATLLFNSRGHIPVLAPDGHQVSLGEYNLISGTASIKCIKQGSHVVMNLTGLIPNGVYNIFLARFQEPGFDPMLTNAIGFGALGALEGKRNSNSFKANEIGNANFSIIRPEGDLLGDGSGPAFGSVSNCLGDAFETRLAIVYRLDGVPASPGAPTTWIVQGFFQIPGI